ncbi:MAG: ABC transporter permease [Candidatus Aminicenantes bacterium]|nr:ABC transporter permease [Candidatus Aminicenantes bacterium]
MNFEVFVARRYLTARRKQAFISVITFISALGVTIGVMALIIAIALITGFQNDVQEKILGSTSHIMIKNYSEGGIAGYEGLIDQISKVGGVVNASPVILERAFLIGPINSEGAIFRGIDFDTEKKSSSWLQSLEMGQIPTPGAKRDGILLGRDLAFSLGATVGGGIDVLTTATRLSPLGAMPKRKKFEVTGLFKTGLYEFDSGAALVSLETAQRMFNLGDRINVIHIRIENIFQAPAVAEKIKDFLPPDTYAITWMELNRSLFSALKLEKQLMFFTITLIVFVAALNIIATLILMVMEKTRDIGILIAMGATARHIRKIFFMQGAMIGIIGTAMGTVLGLIWCWLANTFELIKVPQDIYQIPFVPFRIQPLDLLMIIGVTLLISFLSTLFPAHRASRVDPVDALKYE